MKKISSNSGKSFLLAICFEAMKSIVEPDEELSFYDQVDLVRVFDTWGKSFCYLGDWLNRSGGSEAAMTGRLRIGWIKFCKCGQLLHGRKLSMKIKGKIYQSCVRSTMLYGSERWRLRENETAILRRTEKEIVRAMCEVRLVKKKSSQ